MPEKKLERCEIPGCRGGLDDVRSILRRIRRTENDYHETPVMACFACRCKLRGYWKYAIRLRWKKRQRTPE